MYEPVWPSPCHKGALALSYRTQLWTTQRIAQLIRKHFGVPYHRDHIGRLMRSLGWSCEKPQRRALERDAEAMARWKRAPWPKAKRGPQGWVPISSGPVAPRFHRSIGGAETGRGGG